MGLSPDPRAITKESTTTLFGHILYVNQACTTDDASSQMKPINSHVWWPASCLTAFFCVCQEDLPVVATRTMKQQPKHCEFLASSTSSSFACLWAACWLESLSPHTFQNTCQFLVYYSLIYHSAAKKKMLSSFSLHNFKSGHIHLSEKCSIENDSGWLIKESRDLLKD